MNLRAFRKRRRLLFDRLLQKLELRTGIRWSNPSEVWLKLTERCNCRCQMCDIWKQNRFSDGELTTQDWKKVLLGLRQWLGKMHIWFTGGDPFLRNDCVELIGYSSSIGLSTGVITNGILLGPDDIPLLIEAGLNEYHVSIDSMDPKIHDHLRGITGAHKRATGNVLLMKEFLNKSGKQMKIVIKTIIMGYNTKEILPLVEWTEKSGFNEIKFQPLESNLEGGDDPQWFNRSPFWPKGKEVIELAKIMERLIVKREGGGKIYNSIQELKSIKEYFLDPVGRYEQAKNHNLIEAKKRQICSGPMAWMEILSHGGLRICRYMPPQGDIRTTTPREFWRNRMECWKNPAQFCFRGLKKG